MWKVRISNYARGKLLPEVWNGCFVGSTHGNSKEEIFAEKYV